jgi:hypothetical protein
MMLTRNDTLSPWSVTTPFTGRADRGKANGLLTRLTNLAAEEFVDTPAAKHGVEGLRGSVTLAGDGGKTWTVLVGAEKKKGDKTLVEVRDGERGQVILAESALAQDVLDPFTSWRDKQLFDFFVDDVTRVALPAEATPLAFTRDEGRMFVTTGGSPVMVNDEANALLRSARDAMVVELGKDAPAGSRASTELGFEKPFVKVQWTAQEKPYELVVGAAKAGTAQRWARTHESPTAVLIDADPIVRAAASLAAASKPKPASPAASPVASATDPPTN